jgi:predicted nucleotidyltransferase
MWLSLHRIAAVINVERRQSMLRSDEILDFLKQHKQDFEARFSVRRIGLFGSVLRGSASDSSDVDILVELVHPTFDQYMDLKFFLEDKLGRPVDLVLADSLKPRLKPIITREVAYA